MKFSLFSILRRKDKKVCIIRYSLDELKKKNIDFETTEEYKIEQALKNRNINFDVFVTPERYYEINKNFIKETFGKYNIILNRDKAHYRSTFISEATQDLLYKSTPVFYKLIYKLFPKLYKPIPIINSAETSSKCWDKAVTTKVFEEENIPHPKTVIVNDNVNLALKVIEEKFQYPVVIKTSIGSHGNSVYIVDIYEQANITLKRLSKGPFYQREFYIQEYIHEGDRDIRCFVIGDKVVAQYMRVAAENERRSNIHLGGKGIEYKLNKELEELALKAAKAVGGGILGIDIFETKKGYVVNEINEVPEFNGCLSVTKVDIPNLIIDYLLEKAK